MKKSVLLFLCVVMLFISCSPGAKKKIAKFDSIGQNAVMEYQLRGKVKKIRISAFEKGILKTQILCFDAQGKMISDETFFPGENSKRIFIRKNGKLIYEKTCINDELTDSLVYFYGSNGYDSVRINYGLSFVEEKHCIYNEGNLIKKIYLTRQSIQRTQGKAFGNFWFNSLKDTFFNEENKFDNNWKIKQQVDTGNNYIEKKYFDSLEYVLVDTLIEKGQFVSGKIETVKTEAFGTERVDTISSSMSSYSSKFEIHKYKYGEAGNCIEDECLKGKIEQKRFQLLDKPEICKVIYIYDEHGNWTKAEYTYDSGKKPETVTREIEYYN
jgi:hypothetical protein